MTTPARRPGAKNPQVLDLLLADLGDAAGRAGLRLTPEQVAALAPELLPLVRKVVRLVRPVHRPDDDDERTMRRDTQAQAGTIEKAEHHYQPWTGGELDLLHNLALTAEEVARRTGRTYYAVKTKRKRLRVSAH